MRLDTVYLRNLFRYSFTAAAEQAIMGSSLRDVPNRFSYNDHTMRRWKPNVMNEGAWHSCSSMPGLFMTPHAIKPDELKDVLQFVDATCTFSPSHSQSSTNSTDSPAERGPARWVWFEYDARRFMAPVLLIEPSLSLSSSGAAPSASASTKLDPFRGFEVFGESHPPETWLRISSILESCATKENGHGFDSGAVQRGAKILQHLPKQLRYIPEAAAPTPSHSTTQIENGGTDDTSRGFFEIGAALAGDAHTVQSFHHAKEGSLPRGLMGTCHFAQLQVLERGVSVRPHIDAANPPAEVIATLVLQGEATVRVGATELDVAEGDAYLICGPARWGVKHEVLASSQDRMSITLRFSSLSLL